MKGDGFNIQETQRAQFFSLAGKKIGLLVVMVIASCGVVIFNMLYMSSPLVGLASSIVFFASIGIVCGKVLYNEDPLIMRFFKGWFTFLVFVTVPGVLTLYLDYFTEIVNAIIIVAVTMFFLVLFFRKSRSPMLTKSSTRETKRNEYFIQVSLSIASVAIVSLMFYVLWGSRTGEPMLDVWRTIPVTVFLSLLFFSAFILVVLVFLKSSPWTLALIILQSVLIESIYVLVWYPSLYGDPLSNLASVRWVDRTGTIYAREYLLSQGYWLDIIKGKGYPSFVASLTRTLSFDAYWVHNIMISLIWAIVIPLSLYEITCLIVNKPANTFPREARLAAFTGTFLIPWLIIWGANPTPNTLSFIFMFFFFPALAKWYTSGGKKLWIIASTTALAAFMTHPMPGIFAFTFLFIVMVLRRLRSSFLKAVLILGGIAFCLFALGYGSEFTLRSMFSVENAVSFENALLTIPFIVGLLGFFMSLKTEGLNRRVLFFVFSLYIIAVFSYYVSSFGMANVAWGSRRVFAISDFLLAPFIAVFLDTLATLVPARLRSLHFDLGFSRIKSSINARSLAILMLCVIIAFQSAVTIYQAYPHNEVTLAPTAYEIEAVEYLNSTGPRPFVVVSDTLFTNLALGLLGQDYAWIGILTGAAFGVPDWGYPLQHLYWNMTHWPSVTWMEKALAFAYAKTAYFVLSIRLSNFYDVLEKVREILEVDKIFGGGKLYIFRYPMPPTVGLGPLVSVTYNQTTTEKVQSTFTYTSKDKVTYSVELKSHESYNVTDYPKYWIFKSTAVNGIASTFDNSSDINTFIFKKGLNPSDVLTISWLANEIYPVCGWKEDSFKSGWTLSDVYNITPKNDSDGNILSLSGDFTFGIDSDIYLVKQVGVSTDDFPYIVLRWKSTGPVAIVWTYFGLVGQAPGQLIVPFASQSNDWVTTVIQLELGMHVTYVMVGVVNTGHRELSGPQALYVDYILFCNKG